MYKKEHNRQMHTYVKNMKAKKYETKPPKSFHRKNQPHTKTIDFK